MNIATAPREAVLARLSKRHDYFVALERNEWKRGHVAEAEGAHRIAMSILRAYVVEDKDPSPEGLAE